MMPRVMPQPVPDMGPPLCNQIRARPPRHARDPSTISPCRAPSSIALLRLKTGPRPGGSRARPSVWTGSWLCLVTGWPLLKRPHVAVGVTEIRVEDAAHVLHVAQVDA